MRASVAPASALRERCKSWLDLTLAGDFDNDKALPECLRRVLQLRSASVSVFGLMKKAIVTALGTS